VGTHERSMTAARLGRNILLRHNKYRSPASPSPLRWLLFTHKSGGCTQGVESSRGQVRHPAPLPVPSPHRREHVLSNRDGTAGRGANLMSIPTRGGGRCAPLPRATICSPFRAQKRLAVRLQRLAMSSRKDVGTFSPRGERGAETSLNFWTVETR
jgi:hypothetical protein